MPLSQIAALQALPLTFFVDGVNGCVFAACQFPLKRREVDKLQSIRLRDPDGVALRIFVEQAERSCGCEFAGHAGLQFPTMLPASSHSRQ